MRKFNGNYHKMRMIEEKFIINEEQDIVVCRQKYAILPDIDWRRTNIISYDIDGKMIVSTGTARCSKDDMFDEKTGRMIAQTRASMKSYRKYRKWASALVDEAERILNRCRNTVSAAMDFSEHDRKKIAELMK